MSSPKNGYVQNVLDLESRIAPFVTEWRHPYPRWISTPDGDEGREWCSDCGYYKLRNLRQRDRKHRDDYHLDGGWRTEGDHFCYCAGCGVRLDVSLTDYGLEQAVDYFEDCGFSTSVADDAYEISELLNSLNYRYNDDDRREGLRSRVIAITQQFLDANAGRLLDGREHSEWPIQGVQR